MTSTKNSATISGAVAILVATGIAGTAYFALGSPGRFPGPAVANLTPGPRRGVKLNASYTGRASPDAFTFYAVPLGTHEAVANADGLAGYTIFAMTSAGTIQCIVIMTSNTTKASA